MNITIDLDAVKNSTLTEDDAGALLALGEECHEKGDYSAAVAIFCTLCGKGFWQEELKEFLLENYSRPNEDEFRKNYGKNRRALKKYKFYRGVKLPAFDDLAIKAVYAGGDNYVFFDEAEEKFGDILDMTRTQKAARPFFRDLSKPLFVENEYNTFHYEYLTDNVRRSEDYAADNHIYFAYEDPRSFFLFLQTTDITKYLEQEKPVFLIGRESALEYPLNFKYLYGIDYSRMKPKPVRMEEIKRIFVNWDIRDHCGNYFLMGVMDNHKNLLTTQNFALSSLFFLYDLVLKNKTVEDVVVLLFHKALNTPYSHLSEYDVKISENGIASLNLSQEEFDSWSMSLISAELRTLFPIHENNRKLTSDKEKDLYENELTADVFAFVRNLGSVISPKKIPTKEEWYKAFFLAYAMTRGQELNRRIAPAIWLETHYVAFPWLPISYTNDIFYKMPYFKGVSILRRPTIANTGAMNGAMTGYATFKERNYINVMSKGLFERCEEYLPPNDPLLPNRGIIRFEDLKLYPQATLEALCDFLDIEWDDALLSVTANGAVTEQETGDGKIVGYDIQAVDKWRENISPAFDYYRKELVIGDDFLPWGYENRYYTDGKKYTIEEIHDLFDEPFKCEEFHNTPKQLAENEEARQRMHELIDKRLRHPLRQRGLVPIPWIRPKGELMEGKLYH